MFARKWLILGAALLAVLAGGLKILSPQAATGSQITVSVNVSRTFVPADGTSTVQVNASVQAGTTPQWFRQIRWGILPANSASFSGTPQTDTGLGSASATFVAGSTPGKPQIVVTDTQTGQVGIATINQYGHSAHLAVSLGAAQVVADGSSTVVATATATDSAGVGVPVDTVGFSAASDTAGGSVKIGAVTNNGDGTYSARITSGTKADIETITATDSSTTPATASAQLTEIPGPAAAATVSLAAASKPSDGTATTMATATVADAFGNRRASDSVAFHTDGHVTFDPTVNQGGGVYTSIVHVSTIAGVEHITAVDGSVSSPAAVLTVTPGAAVNISLSLGKSTISTTQNPPDSTTASAVVTDVHGNAVPHESVSITTDGHAQMGAVVDHGDGSYTATITAKSPGPETIKATDAAIQTVKTATAPLTELGPVANLTLTLNPTHIHKGASNSAMATVSVTDSAGDPEPGITVTFGSDSGMLNFSNSGTGTTDAAGMAHVQVNGVDTAGPQTVYVSAVNKTTSAVLVEYDTPSTMTIALSAPSIVADGTTTSVATVTVADGGNNGVPGQTVTLGRTATGAAIDPMSDNGDGTYTFMLHSSKVAQAETLTAGDASYHLTASATLNEVAGPATTVTVSPNPASMTADGTSTQLFTATVADTNGNRVAGEHVTMHSTGAVGMVAVTAGTAGAAGTYTSTATASTVAGSYTVTATDDTVAAHVISGMATLKLVPGTPTHLAITPGAAGLVADGHSTTNVTVRIEDANSNGVYGEHLTVGDALAQGAAGTADLGSAVTDNGDGTYTVTLTASKTADVETITVTDAAHTALTASVPVTENPGAAASVTVSPATPSVSTDQTSGVTFTATVADANGNAVKNDHISFAGSGGVTFPGAVTVVGDGTYTATATPASTAGVKTITATDTSVSSAVVSGQATLTETPGAPVSLTLTQSATTLTANGTSTMTLTATVTDKNHNGVSGRTLGVTPAVNGGGTPGIKSVVTDNGNGTYTVTLTSGTKADNETVTVTDGVAGGGTTATPSTTASATITQVAGPPALVGVALTADSTVTANGSDQRTVTVTVTDANGNPVSGEQLTLSASGAATFASSTLTSAAAGTASTLVTASKTAGKETITATDGATHVQGSATLTENPGAAASITVSVPNQNLFDDGRSTVAVSALVKDVNGNPIPNEQVSFSSGNLVSLSPATAAADATGTAVTTARARTTPGTETVTATDAANGAITASVTLTLGDQDNYATFVKAAYQTLLSRNVDANGLAYWAGQMRNGMSPSQFASTITSSTEYRSNLVSHMYQPYLHRSSDSRGVSYWVGQIASGATIEQVRLSFIGSPEYFQVHGGTSKGAVDALYKDVLARSVEPAGEQYWVQQLDSHQLSFSQLAAGILYSEEGREHLVSGYYQDILGRQAPGADLAYWAGQLRNGTRDEAIVNLFVGSQEYFTAH